MKRKSSGFTIVELLIVIVIIGILAALVITVYNGIQQRARNISRIASAKETQKLLSAYIAQEGKNPYTTLACIGTDYTDWDGDGTQDCYTSSAPYHPHPTLDMELKKVATLPKLDTSSVKGNNGVLSRGFLYQILTVDGQVGRVVTQYFLEGTNQNCGVPGISVVGGAYVTNGSPSYNPNFAGNTQCIMIIPVT